MYHKQFIAVQTKGVRAATASGGSRGTAVGRRNAASGIFVRWQRPHSRSLFNRVLLYLMKLENPTSREEEDAPPS